MILVYRRRPDMVGVTPSGYVLCCDARLLSSRDGQPQGRAADGPAPPALRNAAGGSASVAGSDEGGHTRATAGPGAGARGRCGAQPVAAEAEAS